jgi:hypothetical protein
LHDALRPRIQRIMATTEARAELVRQTIMDRDASEADLEAIVEAVRGTYEQRQIWAAGVARDEVTPAVNVAALHAAAKTGVTTKTWLSSRDEKVRHTHTAMGGGDGQERTLFGPFVIGGFPLMYPGDPTGPPQEVRGCRCVMTFKVDAEHATDDDGQERAHPYLWHVLTALERLLDWLGELELPENVGGTPEQLEGQGHLLELLSELIQVHAAQAKNASPRAATTRVRILDTFLELGTPEPYLRSVERALRAREGEAVQ